VARLREAHALYRHLGAAGSAARVRARLLATGIRVRHWRRADRPAFGWESLTETEQRVVHLVARGLSNRQIASQMYLSIHTIAFHLRRIWQQPDLTFTGAAGYPGHGTGQAGHGGPAALAVVVRVTPAVAPGSPRPSARDPQLERDWMLAPASTRCSGGVQ
jgi:hypothetical protein